MEIILLEKIPHVGDLGARVKVKAGFARNFLIPKGKALTATKGNISLFEVRRAELEAVAAQRLASAQARAKAFEGVQVSIKAQAGEEGRLFGSVGAAEITQALNEQGFEIHKNEVRLLAGSLRQLGDYEVELHLLGHEVTTKVQVAVVAA